MTQQQTYYWLWGETQGRRIALGPYFTDDEARERGRELLGGSFEVVELRTRDLRRATQILKARTLQETQNIDYALQKVRHRPEL